MARYIDADRLEKEMYHKAFEKDSDMQKWDSGCWIRYKLFADCLEKQPTADVVEVVHGEWEKDPTKVRGDGEIYDYRCSECKQPAHKGDWGNNDLFTGYCPDCGAKMDGKKVE